MKIEKFLRTFQSQNTVRAYKNSLRRYFKYIYPDLDLETASEQYFKEIRNYEDDISGYFSTIKTLPPMTMSSLLSGVRSFLIENDVELSEKFWRRLRGRKKGTRALTQDKVPSNLELRKILSHMPIHGKALYLALASGGMRIGEALKLKPCDIQLDSEPAKVSIRGEYTKSGNPRITFISTEAREAIEEWLKVRDQYLQAAVAKSTRYQKTSNDQRLFPFEDVTAYAIWQKAINKAGFNERDSATNRQKMHPHVLRKFFRTKMGSLIPVDIAEALMGHEGYLTEVYRRYSEEDLAGFYKKGEGAVLVFSNGIEVSKLRIELEEANKNLQSIVNGLTAKNLELEQRVKQYEAEFEKYKPVLEKIKSPELLSALEKIEKTLGK